MESDEDHSSTGQVPTARFKEVPDIMKEFSLTLYFYAFR